MWLWIITCCVQCKLLFSFTGVIKWNSDPPSKWHRPTYSSNHTTAPPQLNSRNHQQRQYSNHKSTSRLLHLICLPALHVYHHLITAAHSVLWSNSKCWSHGTHNSPFSSWDWNSHNFSCDAKRRVCLFVRVLQSTPGACDLCSDLRCAGLNVWRQKKVTDSPFLNRNIWFSTEPLI